MVKLINQTMPSQKQILRKAQPLKQISASLHMPSVVGMRMCKVSQKSLFKQVDRRSFVFKSRPTYFRMGRGEKPSSQSKSLKILVAVDCYASSPVQLLKKGPIHVRQHIAKYRKVLSELKNFYSIVQFK